VRDRDVELTTAAAVMMMTTSVLTTLLLSRSVVISDIAANSGPLDRWELDNRFPDFTRPSSF